MAHRLSKKYKFMSLREGAAAYAALRTQVVHAGLLDRAYAYYFFMIALVTVGFFCSLYFLYVSRSIWAVIVASLSVAVFTIQCAGLVHDAGHRAIAKSPRVNDVWGHIFATLIGMNYSEWKEKHDAHHSHPNQEEEDPDLDVPLLSFTKERLRRKKGIGRFLARYQAFLYYPMGSFVAVTMRIAGIGYLKKNFRVSRLWEIVLYGISLFIWFVAPFLVFGLGKALLALAVVHLTTGLYALHIFAPNHKGMPELAKNVKISFFEQQIITSRNIHANIFNDLFYMGLNYQIEHHLFPATPRLNLFALSRVVQKACKKNKLEYASVSIMETDKIILSELYTIARTA